MTKNELLQQIYTAYKSGVYWVMQAPYHQFDLFIDSRTGNVWADLVRMYAFAEYDDPAFIRISQEKIFIGMTHAYDYTGVNWHTNDFGAAELILLEWCLDQIGHLIEDPDAPDVCIQVNAHDFCGADLLIIDPKLLIRTHLYTYPGCKDDVSSTCDAIWQDCGCGDNMTCLGFTQYMLSERFMPWVDGHTLLLRDNKRYLGACTTHYTHKIGIFLLADVLKYISDDAYTAEYALDELVCTHQAAVIRGFTGTICLNHIGADYSWTSRLILQLVGQGNINFTSRQTASIGDVYYWQYDASNA